MPSDSSSPPSNDLQLLSRRVGTGARAHRRKLRATRQSFVRHCFRWSLGILAHSCASGPLRVRPVGLPRRLINDHNTR